MELTIIIKHYTRDEQAEALGADEDRVLGENTIFLEDTSAS